MIRFLACSLPLAGRICLVRDILRFCNGAAICIYRSIEVRSHPDILRNISRSRSVRRNYRDMIALILSAEVIILRRSTRWPSSITDGYTRYNFLGDRLIRLYLKR